MFCAGVGIPGAAAGFRTDLQTRLGTQCQTTDAAYPDLADFAIDDAGRPSLKQYRAAPPTASGQALALALRDRMPERTLMGILARTGHWLEWWRRFSPASGSDPKLKDPFARYILTTRSRTARTSARRRPPGISPGCHRPRAVDHVGPARHDRQAEQGDRRHRGRVHRAGPDQGLG